MHEPAPDAILRAEITVQRAHLSFLNAAFRHAGFDVSEDFEGITTDDGVDSEVKMRLHVHVPIDVLAGADEPTFVGEVSERIREALKLTA